MVLTFTENEDWPAADDLQSLDTQHVSREHFDTAVDMLDREGRVVLCGPPKSGKSSLGYALLKHYQRKGFAAYYLRSLCCHLQLSLSKEGRSFVLIDGGLGVVRLDIDQHKHYESLLFNTRTLRNNRHCLVVFTAYPHVLRELDFLEDGSSRPLLPSTVRIDVTSRPQDPSPAFTPSADSYLPLLRRMLRDPTTGRATEALLAMSMLGIGHFKLDPPEVEPALQYLKLTNVPSFDVKRLAFFLKGFILSDTSSGFPSRLLYDAAGLALGRFCSLAVLLQVCDVTFLVQRVRTSRGTPTESSILISPAEEERMLLIQRMHELIVDGQLPELCQHPSLGCPDFLDDFRDFCTRHENVQQLVNAVDTEHGLPLLYWSAWSPSEHLTRWVVEHVTPEKFLSQSLLTAALALVLFTPADAEARSEAKGFLNSLIRLKLKPAAKETHKLMLPLPRMFATEETRGRWAELKTCLQSHGVCYHDDPSLPIPATLLSVTVTEDAVSVELPSRHWYLALRLLADREVDETDDDGNTLLHLAADAGHLQVIAVAVESGASVTVTNRKGLTPYQLAQRRRKSKKHVSGFRDNSRSAGLHQACSEGNVERLKVLLCQGARLSDKGGNGDTPLHSACRAGQTEVASLLIQLGAAIHKDWYCCTPLHYACESCDVDTIKLLVELGADVNAKRDNGNTPLHCACMSCDVDTIRLLVELGADVNAKRNDGGTPLHCACQQHVYVDTIRLLVELGADVNVKRNDGGTPLHCACQQHVYVDTIRLLVELGADVNVKRNDGVAPLHCACQHGHVDTIRLLVELGADVNVKRNDGVAPLHCACQNGHEDTVRLLVELGADVNVKRNDGVAPLHCACQHGHVDTIRLLVELGADVNVKMDNGDTTFHSACEDAEDDLIRLLVELGADVNVKSDDGDTPLHCACKNGDVDTIRLLVELGADVNVKRNDGVAPLHCACQHGHVDTIRLLVELGADFNVKSDDGDTPLHCACKNGDVDTIRLLVELGADVNVKRNDGVAPLHCACQHGHVDTIRLLVELGADVNVKMDNGDTAFHSACEDAEDDLIRLLVELGADVNVKRNNGDTALHCACAGADEDTIRLLVELGADVNVKRKNGDTALHCACAGADEDTIRLLVELGADVNVKRKNGDTALHCACAGADEDTIRLLVELGADVNVKRNDGVAPLHCACQHGHVDTIRLLMELGADVNVKRNNGVAPLHCACQHGHVDTVRLLVELGAHVNVKGDKGNTPLHCACQNGHVDTVRLLVELGADVNVKRNDGGTPLHCACQKKGRNDTIRLLVELGADVNVKRNDGGTPLHCACQQYVYVDTIRLLVELGADVNAKSNDGNTPLHLACGFDDVDTHGALVELDDHDYIKSDIRPHDFSFPFSYRNARRMDIAKVLLELGADVNQRGRGGYRPLHHAQECGHVDTVTLLKKHGACV